MVLELKRADGVRDALHGVLDWVSEIIHGVYAPLVTLTVMSGFQHAVDNRVAHVDVGRSHVDFCAEHQRAVGDFSVLHVLEQRKTLLHGAVAVLTFHAGLGERAAHFAHLLGRNVVDVSLALFNQLYRRFVHGVEIVGSKVHVAFPAQPLDVGDNRADELVVLFHGVGVVETQVALAAVLDRRAVVVKAYRLCVTDVQVSVRLGRKARDDLAHSALGQVLFDDFFNKVCHIFSPKICLWLFV